jgi:hypothetical protein
MVHGKSISQDSEDPAVAVTIQNPCSFQPSIASLGPRALSCERDLPHEFKTILSLTPL